MDYQSSKNKKKISSIPWAHRIRLSAHTICITLGTADIASSRRDFQFYISTVLITFEGVLWRQNLDLVQPFLWCSQATHPSHAHAKSYPEEQCKIPISPKIFSFHFHARISTYMVALIGLKQSTCPAFPLEHTCFYLSTREDSSLHTHCMKSMLNSFFFKLATATLIYRSQWQTINKNKVFWA